MSVRWDKAKPALVRKARAVATAILGEARTRRWFARTPPLLDPRSSCLDIDLSLIVVVNATSPETLVILDELASRVSKRSEVVIVDNSCSESASSAISNVALKHRSVQVVNHVNRVGPEVARDNGLLVSRGDQVLLFEEPCEYRSLPDEIGRVCRDELIAGRAAQLEGQIFDVVFLPLRAYHAQTSFMVARELERLGVTVCVLDVSSLIDEDDLRDLIVDWDGHSASMASFLLGGSQARAAVMFNDWSPQSRVLIEVWRELKVKTIGFVEGIQDFLDEDIGTRRNPYQFVDSVLLSGNDDSQYFDERHDTKIVGVPRLTKLLDAPISARSKNIVLVNVNFSYGVLSENGRSWLKDVEQACVDLGLDLVVTRHPADNTNLEGYEVTKLDAYTALADAGVLVSRFSSLIIEALCMGTPVIYYNPKLERVRKFQNPMGGFLYSKSLNELKSHIDRSRGLSSRTVRDQARPFLEHHCNIHGDDAASKSAEIISEMLTEYVKS